MLATEQLRGADERCLDDVNGVVLCAVSPRHFHVELADGSIQRDIAILLVHIVESSA